MIYNKYVQIGRVVFISQGKDEGKLAVVVNVVDANRVSILFKICFVMFHICAYRCLLMALLLAYDAV